LVAVCLSAFLHVFAAVAILAFRPAPLVETRREIEPIQLVFPPRDDPTRFAELPPDRAEESDERAELLSNVTSRARDEIPGAATSVPRSEGESEVPEVELTRGDAFPPFTEPDDAKPEAPEPEASPTEPPPSEVATPSLREFLLRDALRDRSAQPPTPKTRPGNSEVSQPAGDFSQANALLSGDISLSTTAWDYAPWLQAFRRDVSERWHAPSAYNLGLNHGRTLLELKIDRTGTLREMRVLDGDVGHRSLREAAEYAVREAAPYLPLPEHFPDETLTLQIKFVYPRLRR
jgi:hypothetical protein